MRIDRLTVQNFKKFSNQTFTFDRNFSLLVGDNGSGKTSLLDALAVALGLWHKAAPGSGWRYILAEEIRLEAVRAGDRVNFKRQLPVKISAEGQIGQRAGLRWTRMIKENGSRTTNGEAKDAENAIANLVKSAEKQNDSLPVLAYYGAGRAWLPTNKRPSGRTSLAKAMPFDAYRYCLDTRIRDRDLNEWFLFETLAANGQERGRAGFLAVKQAVLRCIPAADGIRFDADLKEIVLSISGNEQPFYNLSAGQRTMLALVADIAIKAVTLNSHLLGTGDAQLLLTTTPGVVLIDELDVHLHPSWQRRVASDLKSTFPNIQFVCTSHSPQVIGEVPPEEIRVLDGETAMSPERSIGIDSNRILEELMDTPRRNEGFERELTDLFRTIDQEDFVDARTKLVALEKKLGTNDPEVTRARTLMSFLEQTK